MHITTRIDFDSASPPASGGTTTRADAGLDDTAQPPLTSGFGALMEQERDIQSSTLANLGADIGPQSAAIDRILRHQQKLLGANIALLEQRYEMRTQPARFQALNTGEIRLSPSRHPVVTADRAVFLPSLVAQHRNLLRTVDALIHQRPDGQRGEIILAEIARNHEEMAWMLTALLKEDDSLRGRADTPAFPLEATVSLAPNEANWENEGGSSGLLSPRGEAPARGSP